MAKVGIVGASGYAGAEALRLCAAHPDLEVAWATGDRMAGTSVAALYPNLAAAAPGLTFETFELGMLADVDVAFLALPHGASGALVGGYDDVSTVLVDLAA